MPAVVLILGGTTEARLLAAALSALLTPRHHQPPDSAPAPLAAAYHVISSLAGRTSSPLPLAGEVRIGGFGGVGGLVDFLRERRVDVLVDATHPFAGRMSGNASAAARESGVPLLALRRPGWLEGPGDAWHRVRDLDEAAALLPHHGHRVFLTSGRQGIAAFAELDECWFLARSVEPPEPPMPRRMEVVLDRGPFTLDGERRLLREYRIDVLVSKDSGGPAPKLEAARAENVPVVLVDRPPAPEATATVETVEAAVAWLGEVSRPAR